jgi:hypothetical protein
LTPKEFDQSKPLSQSEQAGGYRQVVYDMWKEIRESNQPPNNYNTKILKVI